MNIKPHQVVITTPDIDKPIILFLWDTIDQLNHIIKVTTSSDDPSYLFSSSAPNITVLSDGSDGNGVIYVAVKCGFYTGSCFEFASENEIKDWISGVFETLGGELDSTIYYEIGQCVYRVQNRMREYSERHLEYDASVCLQYQRGYDSSRRNRVLSHKASLAISNMNKEFIKSMTK